MSDKSLLLLIEVGSFSILETNELALKDLIQYIISSTGICLSISYNAKDISLEAFKKLKKISTLHNINLIYWYPSNKDIDNIIYQNYIKKHQTTHLLMLDNSIYELAHQTKNIELATGKLYLYKKQPDIGLYPIVYDKDNNEKSLLSFLSSFNESIEDNETQIKKLAMFTVLPPQKSGIAYYSKELIDELKKYYKIDVFLKPSNENDIICHFWTDVNMYRIEQFDSLAEQYDRILYHFGNNPMHIHMFSILNQYGGVSILHDFYLSGINWCRENYSLRKNALNIALYDSHGIKSIQERNKFKDRYITQKYPCNFEVIRLSHAIITHSRYASNLLKFFYTNIPLSVTIPLLESLPSARTSKDEARASLSLDQSSFIVCCFGFISTNKLNQAILDAWLDSEICKNPINKLIFVGSTHEDTYGSQFKKRVDTTNNQVLITGWSEEKDYKMYLNAADGAIQLRQHSRGETSKTLLDALSYGLPVIINEHGSSGEVPDNSVIKVQENCTVDDLTKALNLLFRDKHLRENLSENAKNYILKECHPKICAEKYYKTIEQAYKTQVSVQSVTQDIKRSLDDSLSNNDLLEYARTISINFPYIKPQKTLYVDVSAISIIDNETGIQRTVRCLLNELINSPLKGYRIEPVQLVEIKGQWKYIHARQYIQKLYDLPQEVQFGKNTSIQPTAGDIILYLDFRIKFTLIAHKQNYFSDLEKRNVKIIFVVYDLLPIKLPQFYPKFFEALHINWLNIVANFHGTICISKIVAQDLYKWIGEKSDLPITYFHLGANIEPKNISEKLSDHAVLMLKKIQERTSFLMVGTIQPIKGHQFVLNAFETLWEQGFDVNLVIAGKKGWMVESTIKKIITHKQYRKKLIWLDKISDAFLTQVYKACHCLICASENEGFGLPLIEAAQNKLPIIARDIPIFHEVAGQHATYFDGSSYDNLVNTVKKWIDNYYENKHIKSDKIPWLTWKQSAEQLKKSISNIINS